VPLRGDAQVLLLKKIEKSLLGLLFGDAGHKSTIFSKSKHSTAKRHANPRE
jgi:hypothetical protein